MHKLKIITLLTTLSVLLAACYSSNSEKPRPAPVASSHVGVIKNGSIYYRSNCGTCHKVGLDDSTSAFGAIDLAQKHDMITTDMSNFDTTSSYSLMGAYSQIPEQRVADLKAYFESIPKI